MANFKVRHFGPELQQLKLDGRSIQSFDRFELSRRLMQLGVPGVTPETGIDDAVLAYRDFCEAKPVKPFSTAAATVAAVVGR